MLKQTFLCVTDALSLMTDDDGGDDGLSFFLGLTFFSEMVKMMVKKIISLSSVWVLRTNPCFEEDC